MSVFSGLSRLRSSFRKKNGRFSENSRRNGDVSDCSPETPRDTVSPQEPTIPAKTKSSSRTSRIVRRFSSKAKSSRRSSGEETSWSETGTSETVEPKQTAVSEEASSQVSGPAVEGSAQHDNVDTTDAQAVIRPVEAETTSHDAEQFDTTSNSFNADRSSPSSSVENVSLSAQDGAESAPKSCECSQESGSHPRSPGSTVDVEIGPRVSQITSSSVCEEGESGGDVTHAVSASAQSEATSTQDTSSSTRDDVCTTRRVSPEKEVCPAPQMSSDVSVADPPESVEDSSLPHGPAEDGRTSLMSSTSSSHTLVTPRHTRGQTTPDTPPPVDATNNRHSTTADFYNDRNDDSDDNLDYADADDMQTEASEAHDLSFKDAVEAMLDSNADSAKAWTAAGPDSNSDLRRPCISGRRAGGSNPNRVSFGTNLQEVLGKAEEASLPVSEAAGESSKPCEIPPSLTESPSTSALGLHRDPSEDLTCRVCGEYFRKPRILPCLHTFCTVCIVNLQTYPINVPEERASSPKDPGSEDTRDFMSSSPVPESNASSSSFSQKSASSRRSSDSFPRSDSDQKGRHDGGGNRVVLCPTCLREVMVSLTLEELPRNYVAERRVAMVGGVTRLECDSCAEHSESCVVTVRCVDCAENLCSLCELSHRRQKRTKRHQLIDVTSPASGKNRHSKSSRRGASANQKSGQNQVMAPPGPVMCGRHVEEELKLFCMTCDRPVCRDCLVLDHRDHDCQFLCQELFRHQMSHVQQQIRSVVPRISAVDQQLKKVADAQEEIRSRADEITREIHEHIDSFVTAIEQHRQQLLQQVGGVLEEKQHALHVTDRHLRHVRADVEQTCRFVSDMVENASDVEMLSVKRLVTERLSGLRQLSATQHPPVSTFMRFCPSQKGQVINHFQMFGRVVSRKASASASTIFTEGLLQCLASNCCKAGLSVSYPAEDLTSRNGLSTARVNHESSVVLRINSEDGAQYYGRDLQIKAWLIFQNQSIRSLPVRQTLQKNGTFSLRFTPVQAGAHFLHVAVDNQPVKDSPFKFKVKSQWREHKGVWHCCTLCSSGGRLDFPCACRGVMPGGQNQGCSHGQPGHPGGQHWSCCAKMVRSSECSGVPMPSMSPVRQVTL